MVEETIKRPFKKNIVKTFGGNNIDPKIIEYLEGLEDISPETLKLINYDENTAVLLINNSKNPCYDDFNKRFGIKVP